jgi:hypothetical protein
MFDQKQKFFFQTNSNKTILPNASKKVQVPAKASPVVAPKLLALTPFFRISLLDLHFRYSLSALTFISFCC